MSKQEVLKKCAALNIAMAEAEVLDHINDDKSLLAKTALTIFKRPFNRVKKDYPTMHERLIKGYAKFDEGYLIHVTIVQVFGFCHYM